MSVPNKTIYVSEGDQPLYERAQELAGGNLSAAIAKALRRWVETAEGLGGGYEEVTVRVGSAPARRFGSPALVGEWMDANNGARIRVYRGRSGKYVVHVERGPEYRALNEEGKPAGWRGALGIGNVTYSELARESTLEVFETLDELRGKIPEPLFDIVARTTNQPTLEDLDV